MRSDGGGGRRRRRRRRVSESVGRGDGDEGDLRTCVLLLVRRGLHLRLLEVVLVALPRSFPIRLRRSDGRSTHNGTLEGVSLLAAVREDVGVARVERGFTIVRLRDHVVVHAVPRTGGRLDVRGIVARVRSSTRVVDHAVEPVRRI